MCVCVCVCVCVITYAAVTPFFFSLQLDINVERFGKYKLA